MINRAGRRRRAGRHEPRQGARGRPARVVYRGTATIVGTRPGRGPPRRRRSTSSPADNVVVAVGRSRSVPPIEGLDDDPDVDERAGDAGPRAAHEPARPRRRPDRLRAGPGLCPLRRPDDDRPVGPAAGARPTIPRNSEVLARGARARRRRPSGPASGRCGRAPAPGKDGAHVIELDDGSTAEGHAVLLAVGRAFPLDDLGLEHYGIDTTGRTPFPRDGRLRIADGLWVIGDPAGPELHTHQAHYQGEMAVRMALGEAVDARLPRAAAGDLHRPRGGVRSA